jgi:hypothetical protein
VGAARLDWRETLTLAADLALVGILVTVGIVLVVPAGGTVATASYAVHHWCEYRSWPTFADLAHGFRRAFWPGLVAFAVAAAATALLLLDFSALARGAVPGGRPMLVLTAVVAAALVGLAAAVVVEVGRRGAVGWRASIRSVVPAAGATWWLVPALAGAVLLPAFLAWLVPVLVPLVAGYVLFAVHVVARRAASRLN